MFIVHTECPSACSHPFIPSKLGTPFTDRLSLGVAEAWPVVVAAGGVGGRAPRLRVSRSAKAFCILLDQMFQRVKKSTL
jgi:hypothetical protein